MFLLLNLSDAKKTLQDETYGRRKWVIEQAPDEENEEEEESMAVSMKTKNLDPQARKLELDTRVGKRVVVTKEVCTFPSSKH